MLLVSAVFGVGVLLGAFASPFSQANAQSSDRIFELRTYTTMPDRLDALHARFRDHTTRLFEKHGMTNIGYFAPQDEPLTSNTLVYVLAHDSRDAAAASWQSFIDDPEWKNVSEESQRDGRIIEKIETVFMAPTDYSPIR